LQSYVKIFTDKFNALKDNITQNSLRIDNILSKCVGYNQNNNQNNNINVDINKINSSLGDLTAKVYKNTSDVSTNQGDINNLVNMIQELRTSLESEITNNDNGLNNQIQELRTLIESINTGGSTVDLSNIINDISNLQVETTNNKTDIDINSTSITDLQYTLGNFKEKLGNGIKNYIINGGFDVWQRNSSSTITNNSAYVADRWVNEAINSSISVKNEYIYYKPGNIPTNSLVNNSDPFKDGSQIAGYTFDGNANDMNGNFNGVWTGNETYDNGKFGQAAAFMDTSARVNCVDINLDQSPKSFCIWFYWDHYNNENNYLLDFRRGTGTVEHDAIIINSGTDFYYFLDGNKGDWYIDGVKGANTFTKNEWHCLYVECTSTHYDRITVGYSADKSIKFNYNFGGYIDQFRIFNRVLTDTEIKKLYIENVDYIVKKHASVEILKKDATSIINPYIYKFEGRDITNIVGNEMRLSFDIYSNKSGKFEIQLITECIDSTTETYNGLFTHSGGAFERIVFDIPSNAFNKQIFNDKNLGATLYICSNAQVTLDVGDYIKLTNVQLEMGNLASVIVSDFEQRPYGFELDLCRNYSNFYGQSPNSISFSKMRTTPSLDFVLVEDRWGFGQNISSLSNTLGNDIIPHNDNIPLSASVGFYTKHIVKMDAEL